MSDMPPPPQQVDQPQQPHKPDDFFNAPGDRFSGAEGRAAAANHFNDMAYNRPGGEKQGGGGGPQDQAGGQPRPGSPGDQNNDFPNQAGGNDWSSGQGDQSAALAGALQDLVSTLNKELEDLGENPIMPDGFDPGVVSVLDSILDRLSPEQSLADAVQDLLHAGPAASDSTGLSGDAEGSSADRAGDEQPEKEPEKDEAAGEQEQPEQPEGDKVDDADHSDQEEAGRKDEKDAAVQRRAHEKDLMHRWFKGELKGEELQEALRILKREAASVPTVGFTPSQPRGPLGSLHANPSFSFTPWQPDIRARANAADAAESLNRQLSKRLNAEHETIWQNLRSAAQKSGGK